MRIALQIDQRIVEILNVLVVDPPIDCSHRPDYGSSGLNRGGCAGDLIISEL